MIRFIIIDVRAKTETVMHLQTFEGALKEAGLTLGKIDHGTVKRGLAIAVDEFGLFVPPGEQRYFAIDGRLYAGNAVLYGYNNEGHTCSIDLNHCRQLLCKWYDFVEEIEAAIATGKVIRPQIGSSNEVLWQWPGPRPDMTPFVEGFVGRTGLTVIDNDVIIRTRKTESPTDG